MSADAAIRAMRPWLNALRRRHYGQAGLRPGCGLVWVVVAERGRLGRWHLHVLLLLPPAGLKRVFDPVKAASWWKARRGRIQVKEVTGAEGIARYLTKAVAHGAVIEPGPNFPRWVG